MKVRWNSGVFVRSAGDEDAICRPRNGGCTVMRYGHSFVEAIKTVWLDIDEIEGNLVGTLDCSVDEVHDDLLSVVRELIDQGFVESDDCYKDVIVCELGSKRSEVPAHEYTSKESPFADFCANHNIAAELHLDLTDACTEKCVHCYVPQERHFISYEQAEKVLREFRGENGLTVYLTGGECMLHPDFKRICELCVDLNLNIVIMTNLTCSDESMVRFIRKIDPQYLNVSLYSMKANEHDAVTRLPDSWQKTMDAILACEKAGVHIRIATPLLKENQTAFADLKRFTDEHHMHLIPSCDIVAMADHDCQNINHACSGSELKKALRANREIFDRGWDGVMPKCDAKVCDIGTSRLYVNAKGDYYPCDSMHGYVLGNVATHTVTDIWNGEKLAYLRALKNKEFFKCAGCAHRPWCKVCPAANFNATGDLFCPHESACERAAVIREVYGGEKTKC